MHATHIIRRPIVTEKASFGTSHGNRYTFEVAGSARKDQIKAAVQELYKVRVLGVLAPKRLSGPYAQTPTWTEQGYPAIMDTWRGVIGPKGMTNEQIAFWDGVLAKAVATAIWKETLEQNTWEANYLDSRATALLFEADRAEYAGILRDLGLLK